MKKYQIGWKKNKSILKEKRIKLLLAYWLAGGITSNVNLNKF